MSGKWLQEAGFSTGQPLKLHVMPGGIVITVQDIRE
ncbi:MULTISPECIES: SymE family type I addiction module toxin [unclassified Brenneria]|nr:MULTISPECIES: SymE family type I addiction module toxin [unclassified Brenneria]MDX5631168.1 SymE family type I addiction module toxin [Brenneria sp. L3-3Z]MDX5698236.1 SymE family type I addiction module toxin [Brenneria sp. L4-2C]